MSEDYVEELIVTGSYEPSPWITEITFDLISDGRFVTVIQGYSPDEIMMIEPLDEEEFKELVRKHKEKSQKTGEDTAEDLSHFDQPTPVTRFIFRRTQFRAAWKDFVDPSGSWLHGYSQHQPPGWGFVAPVAAPIGTSIRPTSLAAQISRGHAVGFAVVGGLIAATALAQPVFRDISLKREAFGRRGQYNPFQLTFSELVDGKAWVQTDFGHVWKPQPAPVPARIPQSPLRIRAEPISEQQIEFRIEAPSPMEFRPDVAFTWRPTVEQEFDYPEDPFVSPEELDPYDVRRYPETWTEPEIPRRRPGPKFDPDEKDDHPHRS